MKASSFAYVGTLVLSVFTAAWMAGCASLGEPPPRSLAPRTLEDVQERQAAPAATLGRPRIALVLGGGGLRGFAHVGVLRALEEAGVQPDIVVGTSAGAVVGAAYASGLSSQQIEAVARSARLSSLIDFTFSTSGLMRGDNIARWIDTVTSGVPIEKFPRHFAAVATDLQSGKAVLLDSGSSGAAVQASAAVPGATIPVAYQGGHLVDGGASSLVPVKFARAMGADLVIAVDVYCQSASSTGLGVATVLLRVARAQSCAAAELEMAAADIVIAPAVAMPGLSAKDEQARAVATGYTAALAALRRGGYLAP